MSSIRRHLGHGLYGLAFLAAASAGPAPAAHRTAESESTAAESRLVAETLASGIEQLDSDAYAERRAASQLLSSLGKDAIPALFEVAISGSAEASRRAIEILSRHAQSRQSELQEAANAALETIASTGPSGAAMAARNSLRQTSIGQNGAPGFRGIRVNARGVQIGQIPAAAPRGAGGMPGWPGMPGLPGAGVPPGVPGMQGAVPPPPVKRAVRRTVRSENSGLRVYDTDDGIQHVRISEQPDGSIEVDVTVRKAGGAERKQVRAKNVAELKQQDPEAGRWYDTYGPQWNIQVAGGPNPGDARQALLRVQNFIDDRIARTTQALRVTDNPAHADLLRRELERYTEQKRRYEELGRQWRAQE